MAKKRTLEDLDYDGKVWVATGRSRNARRWNNQKMMYSKLVERLSLTEYTDESYGAYLKKTKEQQGKIKDVGGFVGGTLRDGRRKADSVEGRSLLTLDVDNLDEGSKGFIESLKETLGFGFCYYTTHRHCSEKPRYRLVIPLSREVTAEEYQAVGRKLAEGRIGIEFMDDTTYQPSRLMYWPSTSKDGEFDFGYVDEPWLNPDTVLAEYEDWRDMGSWPVSSREQKLVQKEIGNKLQDPEEKTGIVGAFCRAYTIHEAIETFLADVYTPCTAPNRYTYAKGSTAAGAVVYEDKFLYSNHATDPAGGQEVNAFDLVRIHKFGELDRDAGNGKKPSSLPSYRAMRDFVYSDAKTCAALSEFDADMFSDLGAECPGEDGEDGGEPRKLSHEEHLVMVGKVMAGMTKNGNTNLPVTNINNMRHAMAEDYYLKGLIGFNDFTERVTLMRKPVWPTKRPFRGAGSLQWTDDDDSALRTYMEGCYFMRDNKRLDDLITVVSKRNRFHPVRDWLKGLPKWDGVNRVDTLFTDCLGAEDDKEGYTRAAARLLILGMICRVMEPGCKFDYIIMLTGAQGIGKSTFARMLAINPGWFSDSLSDMRSKDAYQQIMGKWVNELAELNVLRKSDAECAKSFLTQQSDYYRKPYGKHPEDVPRQGVFIGTTNQMEFLSDPTGNRRYLPVLCGVVEPVRHMRDKEPGMGEYLEHLFAEGLEAYHKGERPVLNRKMEEVANVVREQFTERDTWEGMIGAYLDLELPEKWYDMPVLERAAFVHGTAMGCEMGQTFKRQKVCVKEVWDECVGSDKQRMERYESRRIGNILKKLGWGYTGNGRFGGYGFQKCYKPRGVNKA